MGGFSGGAGGKESTCQLQETPWTQVRSLGWEDPLEKEMVIHSSIPAMKIPWTVQSGWLQSLGLQSWRQVSTHSHV